MTRMRWSTSYQVSLTAHIPEYFTLDSVPSTGFYSAGKKPSYRGTGPFECIFCLHAAYVLSINLVQDLRPPRVPYRFGKQVTSSITRIIVIL
jgi:hypothetical protein